MIAKLLDTTIAQGDVLKLEYKTARTHQNVTGILISIGNGKVESSLYQDNRSRAVFRKLEFADSVTVSGQVIKRRKGYFRLNVKAGGNKLTGTVKGIEITGTTTIQAYLLIDEQY